MDKNTLKTTKISGIIFKELPPAVQPLVDAAPDDFKLAVLLAALCCYCALGTRLRVKYPYDIDLHALLLQILIVGEPGSGKSFTRNIVKRLMGRLKLLDMEQQRMEQAYAEMKRTSSKAKNLPEEPLTCTRNLQTITRAKLVKRADMFIRKYGEPLAFFFFNEEVATMTESNKRAFADLNTMDRLAYDLGAEYGSDTLSDASYNANVDIIYCSLFCGTDNALKEYINKRSIEGGNVTRKVVCHLPDMLGNKAPHFNIISEEDATCIDQMVKRLMDETYGENDTLQPIHAVNMEWMDKQVEKWCNQQRLEVIRTGSRARDCFYKRSSLSAFRMATMLYYLWNENEGKQKHVIQFYHAMATYIVEGLLQQWGRTYDDMHQNEADDQQKQSLFDLCPDRFSRDQLRELVVKLRLKTEARHFISRWKKARLIHEVKDSPTELFEKNY